MMGSGGGGGCAAVRLGLRSGWGGFAACRDRAAAGPLEHVVVGRLGLARAGLAGVWPCRIPLPGPHSSMSSSAASMADCSTLCGPERVRDGWVSHGRLASHGWLDAPPRRGPRRTGAGQARTRSGRISARQMDPRALACGCKAMRAGQTCALLYSGDERAAMRGWAEELAAVGSALGRHRG